MLIDSFRDMRDFESIMIDENIKKLDEIAKKMETGDLPLEKTLELFNEGIQLVRSCSKTLQDAELKVREIMESGTNEFAEKAL